MGSSRTAFNDDSATESDRPAGVIGNSPDSDSETESETETETETDDDLAPPGDSSPFAEGEKVLASHSAGIYEAKVINAEYRFKEWKYLVHYIGWNKSWDEWIGLDRVMKYTEENIKKQQELNKKLGAEKSGMAWRVSQMKPRSPNVARGRKRKQDSIDKEKNAASSDKLVTFHIPPTLRKQLIDDCEFVTHLGKMLFSLSLSSWAVFYLLFQFDKEIATIDLVKLPRSPNVDDILKRYLDYRTKKNCMVTDSVGEILKGLRCYFDKALPVMLLYKNERKQYEETTCGDVSPSTVYGAEHFLRLFVKLPELLFHANIAEETLKELQHNFVDILRFLRKNQSLFFLSTYYAAEEMDTSTEKQD